MNLTAQTIEDRRALASRREVLTYALILALFLLVAAFGVVVWLMASGSQTIDLGAAGEITPDMPVARNIVLRDGTALTVWIVHTQDSWFVFDARTPAEGRFQTRGCFFQWQRVTGRFEDPCTGAKFSLTGDLVDPYAFFAGTKVQNLDRYPVTIRDGHLWIDPTRIVHAPTHIAPAP